MGDARNLDWIPDGSVHLVTSPPYWASKEYHDYPGQLGAVADDESFMDELDKVWSQCDRVFVPGGASASAASLGGDLMEEFGGIEKRTWETMLDHHDSVEALLKR